MVSRIKPLTQIDEEITEAALTITKLDGADLRASGRLSSDNINGYSSAGFKPNDGGRGFLFTYLASTAVKIFPLQRDNLGLSSRSICPLL